MNAACVICSYMSLGNGSVTCTVWPILLIGLSLHVHGVTCLSITYADSSLCLNINSAGFRHLRQLSVYATTCHLRLRESWTLKAGRHEPLPHPDCAIMTEHAPQALR